MSMKFISILVEGQTEESFVKDILAPHLQVYQLHITPTIIETKRTKSGLKYRGGDVKYPKVKREVHLLLKNSSLACVTTMIDFYGLRSVQDFPKYAEMPRGTPRERIQFLEKAIQEDIDHKRFLPYFSLHEIEAFLFVAPDVTATFFDIELEPLLLIRSEFNTPEDINMDEPPSHRLYDLYPKYGKVSEFVQAIEKVPLANIRAQCPHFHQWLTQLEALGVSP